MIYQDLSLFPNLTVAENIAVGRHLGAPHFVNWRSVRAAAEAAMARIGADLDPFARVEDLSIASRQLVAISRAMAADARLVIMDEPTSSLTRHEVDALIPSRRRPQAVGHLYRFRLASSRRSDGDRRARHRAA